MILILGLEVNQWEVILSCLKVAWNLFGQDRGNLKQKGYLSEGALSRIVVYNKGPPCQVPCLLERAIYTGHLRVDLRGALVP